MKRREFLYTAAAAASIATLGSASNLKAHAAEEQTAPFFVRGLAMLRFKDPYYLQIALPDVPRHGATLTTTSRSGVEVSRHLQGAATIEGVGPGGRSQDVQLPELINMNELYQGAIANFADSPTVISIPWSAVQSISTDVVSEDRWTFAWAESGEDVATFRPRRVAESIQIDLTSEAILKINDGKVAIPLHELAELKAEFTPTHESMGDFTEHFAYYMPYVTTPNQVAEVIPRKLGRQARQNTAPSQGNAFARTFPWYACFLLELD